MFILTSVLKQAILIKLAVGFQTLICYSDSSMDHLLWMELVSITSPTNETTSHLYSYINCFYLNVSSFDIPINDSILQCSLMAFVTFIVTSNLALFGS